MSDFSNSVIMPREDFYELQTSALAPQTLGQRAAGTAQTIVIFGAMAAAVTAGTYGWAKTLDWLETRRHNREMIELDRKYPRS